MHALVIIAWLLSAGWLPPDTLETSHFRFHFVPEARTEAATLAAQAEGIRARIAADLGRAPEGVITVVVVARQSEFQRAQPGGRRMPGWVAGVAWPRQSLIVLGPAPPGSPRVSREVLFAHELSHVALAHAVRFRRLPTWFVEGFADLQALAPHLGDWRDVSGGGARPLDELHRGLGHDGQKAHQSYRQSYDLVRFLRGQGDAAAFRQLVARLEQGAPFEAALKEVYGITSGELEGQWRRRWNWQNVVVPMVTSGLFLWVLSALLLVLGYVRKRRERAAAIAAMDGEEPPPRARPALRIVPEDGVIWPGGEGEARGVGGAGAGVHRAGDGAAAPEEDLAPWEAASLSEEAEPASPPGEEHPLLNMGVLLGATVVAVTLTAILAAIWPRTRLWLLAAPAALLVFVALRWASRTTGSGHNP